MRNLEYATQADVARYLHNTLCRYKQEIVYVTVDRNCRNLHEINVREFGKEVKKIKCTDDDFSVHMPELGYINIENDAFYLKRRPQRVQRAGIPPDYCTFYTRVPLDRGCLLAAEGYQMLRNEYPTFKDAHDKVNFNKLTGLAFSKNLCVRMQNKYTKIIEYKGDIAAIWNGKEYYIPQPRNDTSFIKAILTRHGVFA